MQITRYTDYALRVLIYLAVHHDKKTTINDIATNYQISKNHLMKIVQQLNQQGYLLATRGKNGGLTLTKPMSDINIGTLVRFLEDDNKLVTCFTDTAHCIISPSCQLKGVFAQAQENFFKTLDAVTLQDLIPNDKVPSLTYLLTIE